ncbi:MAG: D-tyrosyl-tRNA(Tyr) deacylase [Bacteroidales bacterium]|nr:D-tyrosyl-tRNA(Tyr) deacylase [Bacteroidales bacterium]
MRTVIQRVSFCKVEINAQKSTSIGQGLLILVGVEDTDTWQDLEWLCNKIVGLRIFNDAQGVMNLSVKEVMGDIMVVSQFTLHASTKKGNRPSYIKASKPDVAIPIYNQFVDMIKAVSGLTVATGQFGADMKVSLLNDGPVTILIDTKNKE